MKRRALLLWAGVAWPSLFAQVPAEVEHGADAAVEVNSATRAQLESLPGIGPALAQRLLAARPFADWSDLTRRVPGIKAVSAKKLSAAGLRVGGEAYRAQP
jgi:competence protein ComEA